MSASVDTIEHYIEATRRRGVDGLRDLSSLEALMSGFYEGEYYSASPEVFFAAVRDNPGLSETGQEYTGKTYMDEYVFQFCA